LAALIHIVPDQLFLFRVNRYNRLASGKGVADRAVDMLELGIPVRMLVPFFRLSVALKAIVHLAKKLSDLFVTGRTILGSQLRSQDSSTLACPA
jgi:hypothetical protein